MLFKRNIYRFSWNFTNLKKIPPDPIFSINEYCKKDSNPNKINLSIGAYQDKNGNP